MNVFVLTEVHFHPDAFWVGVMKFDVSNAYELIIAEFKVE